MKGVVAPSSPGLRPWQRLSVRLAALFGVVTLLAVGVVGSVVHQRQKHELEDTVGAQLLNIARTAALLVDPAAHAEVMRTLRTDSPAHARVQRALATIKTELVMTTPLYTLAHFDPQRRVARRIVSSDDGVRPGEPYALAAELLEPLAWTFEDGIARYTGIYRNERGTWITAVAPINDANGRTVAVLDVDYPVEIYVDRLHELETTILWASLAGGLGALAVGLLFARRLTRPISALTRGVVRVAAGDLSAELPVRSRDEVGQLTRAFNGMLEGLRQRDFIRNTFGRYVSPEVVKAILESPEGLKLGGEKRVVTILMSDLRGYTRFAEHGDPAQVMEVLNGLLGTLTDAVVAHGGTVNEFIGDSVFAVFGAPVSHPDHAERAAAAALAMQRAMAEINAGHAVQGLPAFELGIGLNTGEVVVGNVGSEARAKYGVVGNTVNTTARVESATVGGQVLVSAATYAHIRDLAEVGAPISVAVKGLTEPLVLHELRAIGGRFAQRLPETDADAEPDAAVALPLACWVLEGKIVGDERVNGEVRRLGRGGSTRASTRRSRRSRT